MVSEASFFGGVLAGPIAGQIYLLAPEPSAQRMWVMNPVAATSLRLPYTGVTAAARSKTNRITQEGSRIYCLINFSAGTSISLQDANGGAVATLGTKTLSLVSLRALNPPYGTWHVVTHTLI